MLSMVVLGILLSAMSPKMIGENPIKTNKAKAEDQIIIYYATNAAVAVALVSLPTRRTLG